MVETIRPTATSSSTRSSTIRLLWSVLARLDHQLRSGTVDVLFEALETLAEFLAVAGSEAWSDAHERLTPRQNLLILVPLVGRQRPDGGEGDAEQNLVNHVGLLRPRDLLQQLDRFGRRAVLDGQGITGLDSPL